MLKRLKTVRKSLGLTQREMADTLGVSRDIVASWEIGRVQPSEAILRLICRECNIRYAWLKLGEEPMEPQTATADENKSIERILEGDNDFVKAFLRGLAELPKEAWEQIEAFTCGLTHTRED